MLLKYKPRDQKEHNWMCKEALLPPIREIYAHPISEAPLAFQSNAFDLGKS